MSLVYVYKLDLNISIYLEFRISMIYTWQIINFYLVEFNIWACAAPRVNKWAQFPYNFPPTCFPTRVETFFTLSLQAVWKKSHFGLFSRFSLQGSAYFGNFPYNGQSIFPTRLFQFLAALATHTRQILLKCPSPPGNTGATKPNYDENEQSITILLTIMWFTLLCTILFELYLKN